MKKTVRSMMIPGILIGLMFLAGCAGSKTYLLNFHYDATAISPLLPKAAKQIHLVVYQFQDVRPDRLYLGRRVYRDGVVDFFKPDSGTVEQVVTDSVAKAAEKAGFRVTRAKRHLDPGKEAFGSIPGDVALGGKIETLWVEAKTGIATTDTDAKARLRIYWGFPQDRVWVTKTIEADAQEKDRPLYNAQDAEKKINEVFRDAVDRMLKGDTSLKEQLLKIR
jgi:uncharacterized lipoprotein YajG